MPSYCKLCQMLNDPKQPPKVWNTIDKWWSVTGGHCKPKGSFPFSKIRSLAEETLINDLIIFLLMTLAVLIIFRMQVSFRFGRLLFRFAIPVFVLFTISMTCRASLLIPWDIHLLYTKFHHFLW